VRAGDWTYLVEKCPNIFGERARASRRLDAFTNRETLSKGKGRDAELPGHTRSAYSPIVERPDYS